LSQLDKQNCPIGDALSEIENLKRSEKVIANAKALGVPPSLGAKDLLLGNTKLNTLFVASIFNTKHGLEELNEEELKTIGILDDDIEGLRDERVARLWINSLNIDGVYVEDLYDDFKDGVLFCKVVNKLNSTAIDWKRVELKPKNEFGMNGNNGVAINACKASLKMKMIGIGGKKHC